MKRSTKAYDFLGIGVGPFNLSLACLTLPIKELDGLFLEQRECFDWHPGMMLEDTTLQIPFIADLVTLADPTNPFSFLNYIKEQGRIYSFYIREDFLLLRKEYNHYCQWAVSKLPNIRFGTQVTHIHFNEETGVYVVTAKDTRTKAFEAFETKRLILGTGTSPTIPECCQHLKEHVCHSSQYLFNKENLQSKKSITIVGSGQSAAEIFYDLLQEIEKGYQLHWITRSPRFFPLEYSKLTLEMTSPEYVDYFYSLPQHKRDQLNKEQKHLYKGINKDLIASIFDLLYIKRVNGQTNARLRTLSELTAADFDPVSKTFDLRLHQVEQDKHYKHRTEALVLATGYAYQMPDFLEDISGRINWDDQGRFVVNRNYSIDKHNEIFVQNAELHTHGFVTPDLGMGCYRNSYILREITGKEYYPIEERIAFQQFDTPSGEEIFVEESTQHQSKY